LHLTAYYHLTHKSPCNSKFLKIRKQKTSNKFQNFSCKKTPKNNLKPPTKLTKNAELSRKNETKSYVHQNQTTKERNKACELWCDKWMVEVKVDKNNTNISELDFLNGRNWILLIWGEIILLVFFECKWVENVKFSKKLATKSNNGEVKNI
jgi:hypothetical protein